MSVHLPSIMTAETNRRLLIKQFRTFYLLHPFFDLFHWQLIDEILYPESVGSTKHQH